jgi:hypothetical protein
MLKKGGKNKMSAIPDWSNATTPENFLKMPNASTNGWFWTGMDIMIFLVLFITISIGAGWEAGILSAGFIGIMMTIFLAYLHLVAFNTAGWFIGIIVIIMIYVIWSNRYD